MSPMRRFFLRWHVRLCVFCGKFNKQIMDSQEMCRYYKEFEIESPQHAEQRPKLEESKKNELRELLASQARKD